MLNSNSAEHIVEIPRQVVHFSQCNIDFVEVAEIHISWRGRLKNLIEGDTSEDWSPSVASMEDHCGLGRWLRGVGRVKFGHHSSFRRLTIEHAEFHRFAGMILDYVQNGDRPNAKALLTNEFSQATRRILIAITELNDVMQPSSTEALA